MPVINFILIQTSCQFTISHRSARPFNISRRRRSARQTVDTMFSINALETISFESIEEYLSYDIQKSLLLLKSIGQELYKNLNLKESTKFIPNILCSAKYVNIEIYINVFNAFK